MQTRPLGTTGLLTTRLGLGLAALGRPGYINLGHAGDLAGKYDPLAMRQHAFAVLDAAFSAGVCYFDAARSYGAAEEFLAAWLANRAIRPDQVVMASKWGYTYTADWQIIAEKHEVKDHSLAVLRRQAQESAAWLGPYLRLYQIHSATQESGVLDNVEVLGELDRLREQGWKIGLTLTGPQQSATLYRALRLQRFDCVQATWNLLEPSAGPALAEAHAAGMGIIIKEALANGRLTPRNTEAAFAPRRQLLDEMARRLDTTIDALALAAVLAQPWADVVLSGAATIRQLHSHVAALAVPWDTSLAPALAPLAEPAEAYWQHRATLPWN